MNRKILVYLGIILLAALLILLSGCIPGNKFANDPIKWSYVSGDGSWNANSRKWMVDLSPGETKSILIQLYNSGSQSLTVFTDPEGPYNDHIHLNPQQRLTIFAGSSIEITLQANADIGAPSGSHKYVIDYSNSFSSSESVP
jgi:hypothetical protein